jgi:hypothetical protein
VLELKTKLISLSVSLGILGILVYFSDIGRVVDVLLNVNPVYILVAFVLWSLTASVRTFRWGYLLKRAGVSMAFVKCFRILVSGLFLSNLTPGKVGDPLRNVLLKKSEGVKVGRTLPSVVVERLSDVMAMVSISFLGFIFLSEVSSFSLWFTSAAFIYLFLFSVFLFVVKSEGRTIKVLNRLSFIFRLVSKSKGSEGMVDFSRNIHRTFKVYKDKGSLAAVFLLSLLIWALEAVCFYIAFLALGLDVPLLPLLVAYPLAVLISVVTFLPGGLGSMEAVLVIFFTSFYSLSLAEITAAVLLGRFLTFWIYVILGTLFLSGFKFRYQL